MMPHSRWFRLLIGGSALSAFLFSGVAAAPLKVVATTSMVADLVKRVGGDGVALEALMGAGVDPHLYKPTASDVVKLQHAEVIFYSGLVLEGKMADLFSKMSRTKKYVYAVTDPLPRDRLLQPAQFEGHFDPHVWFDVQLWSGCIEAVSAGLSAADPAGADGYKARAAIAKAQLDALHAWALAKAAELPETHRVLITSHDAYNYFGRAYGFQVVGLQGVSTVSEAGLADMARLVDLIKARHIKAIFVESSVPHTTIERIAKDAGVKIGGELFSDAMGTPGQMENGYDLGTYEGMVKHNLTTMVEALK